MDVYQLPRVRYRDRDHLPVHLFNKVIKPVPKSTSSARLDSLERNGIIGVRVKPKTSQRQYKKLVKLTLKEYERRPKEECDYYKISRPLFSANNEYALVKVNNNGHGCTYFFRMENNSWKLLFTANRWVE